MLIKIIDKTVYRLVRKLFGNTNYSHDLVKSKDVSSTGLKWNG